MEERKKAMMEEEEEELRKAAAADDEADEEAEGAGDCHCAGAVDKNPRMCSFSCHSRAMDCDHLRCRDEDLQCSSSDPPGCIGFANLPNQVHRKSVKKGFEFTLMVVGESGLGKSTLIDSLFLTDLYSRRYIPCVADKVERTVKIETSTVEIEERGVRLKLTIVDTPGYADATDCTDCSKAIVSYVDAQYEKYLQDESGLNRRGIVDTRVHCCFYFINPAGRGLKPVDVHFLRALHTKVNIVPVIAKADTLTRPELLRLKERIMDEIEKHDIQIYPMPDCDEDEDEEYRYQCKQLKGAVPFAVIGSNTVIEVKSQKVRGRLYPWGVVEVENPDHCDFVMLRTMLIAHMQDFQEVTQEVLYENYRSERIASNSTASKKTKKLRRLSDDVCESEQILSDKDKQLLEKESELKRMQELLSRMQAEMLSPTAPGQTRVRRVDAAQTTAVRSTTYRTANGSAFAATPVTSQTNQV